MNTPATTPNALAEATILQWTWKTGAMRRMAVAICKLALERGHAEFSANDLPEFDHGGNGIAGVIFHRLVADEVLARVGTFQGTEFCPKVVSNDGGNLIKVYRLASAARARALLAAHDQPEPALQQPDLLSS